MSFRTSWGTEPFKKNGDQEFDEDHVFTFGLPDSEATDKSFKKYGWGADQNPGLDAISADAAEEASEEPVPKNWGRSPDRAFGW